MKSILITGGAGFIGANFISYLLKQNSDVKIVNLDLLTYAGDLNNLSAAESQNPNYHFVKGDIVDRSLVEGVFCKHDISDVIHFAAESHVDNSISGPDAFIKTNINGTFVLLDVARKYWMDAPFTYRVGCEQNRFHHISTDEVYGSLGETGLFTEETPYAPNSPYSASKAASDLIVRSYHHTYGLNVITTNCSNNYGPKQHDEKLIPTIIRNALLGENIPIYGDGKNIRDWLFVEDHCQGIWTAFTQGLGGQTYNIGGRNECKNIDIAHMICSILDQKSPRKDARSYSQQITYVKDRPGHDRRYAIDASKIENELSWRHMYDFKQGLEITVDWYLQKYS